jgi:PAS domain S-box-containing protein
MSKGRDKRIVLAADDDENAHVLLKHAFTKAGVEAALIQVKDGTEVIQYLSGEGEYADRNVFPMPDLLLLDLKMPKVSGLGVLEYLRRQADNKPFPVIIFSCSDAHQDVNRAHDLGCDAYVIKPGSMDKLIQLSQALQRKFFTAEPCSTNASEVPDFSLFAIPRVPAVVQKPVLFDSGKITPIPVRAETEDIFRLLVEQVKDYGIFMLDLEGKVASWNEGARRIIGYDASNIIGKNFSVLYSHQDLENEKPQFELRMAREMGRYEDDGWRIRNDGSRFWANVVITPLRDSSGALKAFAQITRDLTQRKMQEDSTQRLLDSEERFRLLVDQVKDYAIFILDAKGHIASWNQGARRLKGYSADEVMGKHFSTFYTPEDIARDHPSRELSTTIREGRYEEEGWRVRKDGSRFWASVVITSLWDKRGNLTGFAKVTRDLTARKEHEEALRRKSEELEAFAHTISHDLRSPLRTVSSFAQILRSDAKGLTDAEQVYVDKIVNSAKRMETLINDILNLTQISVSPLNEEILSLEEIIEESLRMLEADIQKSKADIRVAKPLPMLNANRTLLLQVFSNLIGNAIKYAHKNQRPNVHIWGSVSEGNCQIHVKDDGIGIPEKFQSAIFNIFERGAADRSISGSGVGLAVVKKAIERLGGTVAIRSEEGRGSEFVVRIPHCQDASASERFIDSPASV